MEVKDSVQTKLGVAEEATRRLAEILEELEALTDPMRKEISAIRKRVDAINRELKPLEQSCQKKLVTESEKLRTTKLEELSKSIDISLH
ncbi:hypothetical protein Bca4012_082490 [Brassica carinata]